MQSSRKSARSISVGDAGHLGVRGRVTTLATLRVAGRRARIPRGHEDCRDAVVAADIGLEVGRLEQEVIVGVGDNVDGTSNAVEHGGRRERGELEDDEGRDGSERERGHRLKLISAQTFTALARHWNAVLWRVRVRSRLYDMGLSPSSSRSPFEPSVACWLVCRRWSRRGPKL